MTIDEQRNREKRFQRIRRTKQILRPLPRRTNLHRYPIIHRFASMARKKPHLWSFSVRRMTPSFYTGCIIALLPLYGLQIPLAFAAALLFRTNLPVTCGLQLITNPLTMGLIYFVTYKFGDWINRTTHLGPQDSAVGETAFAWIAGGIVLGAGLAFVLDMIYRFIAYEAQKRDLNFPKK
jgi:uncharacterized protein (DUF2062 family)